MRDEVLIEVEGGFSFGLDEAREFSVARAEFKQRSIGVHPTL